MNHEDILRVLAPPAVMRRLTRRLTRRAFLDTLGAGALVVACGTRDDATRGSASGTALPRTLEGSLNIYNWANYEDPTNEKVFTEKFGPKVNVDVFDSQEAMIAKLELAKGTGGYDIVVAAGQFIPQLVSKGLLLDLDKSKIPNLVNIEEAYLHQPWDRDNRYTVVKDRVVQGFVYDKRAIKDDLKGWADFVKAASQKGVSGKVSVVAVPASVAGIVFWRDGIDWRTEKHEDLDHAEQVLLTELAPHIKAFDSYPVTAMLEGSYVLSQTWNGDARVIVSEDPDRYRWVLGAPKTGMSIDNWTILKSAKHPEAAHAWLNFMLEPEVSAREIAFHGFHTAVKGTRDLLPKGIKALELIYLSDEDVARLVPGDVNSAQDRLVAIYNKVKARVGT